VCVSPNLANDTMTHGVCVTKPCQWHNDTWCVCVTKPCQWHNDTWCVCHQTLPMTQWHMVCHSLDAMCHGLDAVCHGLDAVWHGLDPPHQRIIEAWIVPALRYNIALERLARAGAGPGGGGDRAKGHYRGNAPREIFTQNQWPRV